MRSNFDDNLETTEARSEAGDNRVTSIDREAGNTDHGEYDSDDAPEAVSTRDARSAAAQTEAAHLEAVKRKRDEERERRIERQEKGRERNLQKAALTQSVFEAAEALQRQLEAQKEADARRGKLQRGMHTRIVEEHEFDRPAKRSAFEKKISGIAVVPLSKSSLGRPPAKSAVSFEKSAMFSKRIPRKPAILSMASRLDGPVPLFARKRG